MLSREYFSPQRCFWSFWRVNRNQSFDPDLKNVEEFGASNVGGLQHSMQRALPRTASLAGIQSWMSTSCCFPVDQGLNNVFLPQGRRREDLDKSSSSRPCLGSCAPRIPPSRHSIQVNVGTLHTLLAQHGSHAFCLSMPSSFLSGILHGSRSLMRVSDGNLTLISLVAQGGHPASATPLLPPTFGSIKGPKDSRASVSLA